MKKKLLAYLLCVLAIVGSCCFFSSCEKEGGDTIVLYVYNWGEYISDGSDDTLDVNVEFEKYCKEVLGLNVKVNYSTYSSNEDMYAKISSGSVAYDVIFPSDYMIERMIAEDLLAPLNMEQIPNYQYVSDRFKGDNVYYEPEETRKEGIRYSVPYFCGMIGIIYNTAMVPEDEENIGSWELMWDPDYAGEILQFNNSRDAFGTALYKLGYDVNDATDEQWREALDELIKQKSVIQGYVMDEIFNKMQSGSAAVAAYYAGDFFSMYENNEDLAFFYPERTNSYVDAMCIPANSQNQWLANEYINFMCNEEIAKANAEYTYYESPMTTVIENEEYRDNMNDVYDGAYDILYGEMRDNTVSQPYLNLSPEKLQNLNLLWEELKGASSISTGIYVMCGVIVAVLALWAIASLLRRRRWARLYD